MSGISSVSSITADSNMLLSAASKKSDQAVNAARGAAGGLADTAISTTNAQAMQAINQMTANVMNFTA